MQPCTQTQHTRERPRLRLALTSRGPQMSEGGREERERGGGEKEKKKTQDSMRVHDHSHVAVGGEVKVWMMALPLCYFRRSVCAHVCVGVLRRLQG
jgi:hypothetical protein